VVDRPVFEAAAFVVSAVEQPQLSEQLRRSLPPTDPPPPGPPSLLPEFPVGVRLVRRKGEPGRRDTQFLVHARAHAALSASTQ
jgi:hypothetical protein